MQNPHLKQLLILPLLLMPGIASAHTGIGDTTGFAHGFFHPVGGADHLLAMIAVGLWGAQLGGRATWAMPATFVGVMMLGGMLGLNAIALPHIETGILISVVTLGLFAALAIRLPLILGTTIVALFAICHGYAHGAEMPHAAGAITYTAGFALATALLHLAGIGLGRLRFAPLARIGGGAIALAGLWLSIA